MNDPEYTEKVKRALDMLRSEPPFPDRENIHFIRTTRTHYEEIDGLLNEGFTFEQVRDGFEKFGFLPEGSKANSLRQAYYRETRRRNKAKAEGRDPAPWSKKANLRNGTV
jgi:hypothetical protein